MSRNIKRALSALGIIVIFTLTANLPTHIQVGIDGRYREIEMPLYVKWTEFLARHYEYARLSKEITTGCKTDEEKAIALLKWTKDNLKDVPAGMPICDDHILYTIIRGYAVPEQFQDVFTTLCSYSGVPAFFDRIHDNGHKVKYALSFVKLNGKWSVFDAYYGRYFFTKGGKIANIDDILDGRSITNAAGMNPVTVMGVPYSEFFYNINHVSTPQTSRAEKQMPLKRIIFEAKKALGVEGRDV